MVGSDEHAVGSASRTSPKAPVLVACRSQFVPQEFLLRDPARLWILIQHPRGHLDHGHVVEQSTGFARIAVMAIH
jgi:hypothetical protein